MVGSWVGGGGWGEADMIFFDGNLPGYENFQKKMPGYEIFQKKMPGYEIFVEKNVIQSTPTPGIKNVHPLIGEKKSG